MQNPFPNELYLQRRRPHEEDVRGAYFRDQTAIIHSTAFRRLKHKTQVFYAPQNDHICTRIEHVMHVATIAKTICKGLNHYDWDLDLEMTFAIGLGHDLGHAPFGHDGETILNQLMGGNNAFIHEIHSYRVVEYLANKGKGLNLTYGVKDGIITHNGEKFEQSLKPAEQPNDLDRIKDRKVVPSSYEGCVVRFADKIAYLGRDIEDAIEAGFITYYMIPDKLKRIFNLQPDKINSIIIDTLVNDIINESKDKDYIGLSDKYFEAMLELVRFNYKYIYLNDKHLAFPYAEKILTTIFEYLAEHLDKYGRNYDKYKTHNLKLIQHFGKYLEEMHEFYKMETDIRRIVGDYVAGMTDYYAIEAMKQITIPKPIV
jgi:dGTPase